MKILIIDDEIDIAKSIKGYLTPHGILCEMAHNTKDALAKIHHFDYDCILLDLNLPDGEGFDILRALKKNHKTDGVIVVSAKENLETRLDAFHLGADDYLTKPFHLSELLVRIQALVRRKNFKGNNTVNFNEITIDLLSKTVLVHHHKLEITKTEIDL